VALHLGQDLGRWRGQHGPEPARQLNDELLSNVIDPDIYDNPPE
jgi:hypothetical protein